MVGRPSTASVRRVPGRWSRIAPLVVVAVLVAPLPAAAEFRCLSLPRGHVHYEIAVPGSCQSDSSAVPGRCPSQAPSSPAMARCPLVVLVGGFAVPVVVWDHTVPALVESGFTVLRFDLYGRGRSARPDVKAYDVELFADQLWELVSALDLPRPFHIVGSSMGAPITARFANRHPEAVDRVALVGPAGLSAPDAPQVTLLRVPGLGDWYFEHGFRDIMFAHLQDNLLRPMRVYQDVFREYRRQLEVRGTARAMLATLRDTLLADVTEDFRALGRLRRPTRVLCGVHDRLVPCERTTRLARAAIPHATRTLIRGAGHLPQLDQPNRFNRVLGEFLLASDP
jgi:pimeloyl-ACP methyl ester carboxylesterase